MEDDLVEKNGCRTGALKFKSLIWNERADVSP